MKIFLTMVLTVSIMRPDPAFASDGDLDLTFGRGGKVATDFSGNFDNANALAIQSDGKILVAGRSESVSDGSHAVLARYDSDGGLDLTFGIDGKVSAGFFGGFGGLAIQSDGRILVLGAGAVGGFLARYNDNGTLDTTFGNGGMVIGLQRPSELAIQSDGKIIVAEADFGESSVDRLARYNSDGTVDSAFGFGGKVEFRGGSGESMHAHVYALTIQPDGRIVAAGENYFSNVGPEGIGAGDFALARYDSNGRLDPTFGTGGVVRTDILPGYDPLTVSTFESAHALAVQADGKIVAGGGINTARGRDVTLHTYEGAALARYNIDGTLDTAFGGGGKVIAVGAGIRALAIQRDGKTVAAGGFRPPGSSFGASADLEFGLARYERDGRLDVTFGVGGIVTTNFSSHGYFECSAASAVAIQADGKIVAAGMPSFGWFCSPDFALARYDNDESSVDLKFDPDTIRVGNSFGTTFVGPGFTAETYFDVRFRSPNDDKDQITLNWQRGISAVHAATGTIPGAWTVTGVRPHQNIDDHTADFMSVSATLTVVE